jgi:AraC family transcriptional regulator
MKHYSQAALKYPTSTLISSLSELNSPNMAADFRSHRSCSGPGMKGADLEVAITIDGCDDGLVTCKIDGEYQPARPSRGTIWLVPAAHQAEEISISSPELRVLHLFLPNSTFTYLSNEYALSLFPSEEIRYSSVACDSVIEQIGLSVLSEIARPSSIGRMLVETSSLFLAARLLQTYAETEVVARRVPKQKLDPARLKRVLGFIEEHRFSDITVNDLADVACLSMFHFTRAFAASTGLPPHRYVSQRRLEAAKELITSGRMSLTEIALRCQFSSQSSFTRAFRQTMGITPTEYRQLFQ